MRSLVHDHDLREIRERLAALTEADQRLWGAMSVGQMVCHVGDAFAMALGERDVAPAEGPIPPRVMKWMGLSSPLKWPRNLPTVQELKQVSGGGLSVGFEPALRETREKFEQLAIAGRLAANHPFFGQMSRADWMRWGYLHTDHHLRQFGR